MLDLGAPQLCEADIEASEPHPGSYSTDQGMYLSIIPPFSSLTVSGNVSQVCPGIHPVYNIPTDDAVSNHTKGFTKAAISDEAYRLTIQTAQGMAATAWKLLTDDMFAGEVKADFERDQKRRR
jgi:hypothetical protein